MESWLLDPQAWNSGQKSKPEILVYSLYLKLLAELDNLEGKHSKKKNPSRLSKGECDVGKAREWVSWKLREEVFQEVKCVHRS